MKNTDFENKTILVTGGAGFIGSNLCKSLLDLQVNVICFDNFSSGKVDFINDLLSHSNFKLIGGDIRKVEDCVKAMNGVDYVFHMAGLDYNSSSSNDESTINDVNVVGFLNILTVIRESNVKGMIYPTSCSQSNNYKEFPKIDDMLKGKPLSPYVISKYTNELYANLFRNKYGLQIKGVEYLPIFDKTQTTYLSKILQLNINAMEQMLKEELIEEHP